MTTTTAAASAMAKISDSVSGHIQQSTNSGSEEMTEAETAMAINEVGDGNSDGDNNKLKAAAKEMAVAVSSGVGKDEDGDSVRRRQLRWHWWR